MKKSKMINIFNSEYFMFYSGLKFENYNSI